VDLDLVEADALDGPDDLVNVLLGGIGEQIRRAVDRSIHGPRTADRRLRQLVGGGNDLLEHVAHRRRRAADEGDGGADQAKALDAAGCQAAAGPGDARDVCLQVQGQDARGERLVQVAAQAQRQVDKLQLLYLAASL